MLTALLALLVAVSVRGDMVCTLESAVQPGEDGSDVLELTYEIPHTSLVFIRTDSGFVANYRLAVEVVDRSGKPVAGDVWRRAVAVRDYDHTQARGLADMGSVRLGLSPSASAARAEVMDASSERRGSAEFALERPSGGMMLRLVRPDRRYGVGDTLLAWAEARALGGRFDSCRFAVTRDGRARAGAVVAVRDSAGRRVAWFVLPMADSSGAAVLEAGEYRLEAASGLSRATLGFQVDVPFFFDEEGYQRKVDQLLYVATIEEMRRLKALPRAERAQAWQDFWRQRDQTPTTERNEREEEYFERIGYADSHFGHGDRGYRSDRGHVYVAFGPPDQVESRPFEVDTPAQETWYYYGLAKTFRFVDRFGFGEMVLTNPGALDGR